MPNTCLFSCVGNHCWRWCDSPHSQVSHQQGHQEGVGFLQCTCALSLIPSSSLKYTQKTVLFQHHPEVGLQAHAVSARRCNPLPDTSRARSLIHCGNTWCLHFVYIPCSHEHAHTFTKCYMACNFDASFTIP